MTNHRTALSAELKQLIELIRQGKLFDVEVWIRAGKPVTLPKEGRFTLSPMQAAVRTGFHSVVEVLLKATAGEEDVNVLLGEAVSMGRLDLCELVHQHGGNPQAISYDSVATTHNPQILRWFEDHGVDMVSELPLATALRWRVRAALGSYMRCRERMPELKAQINMALRFHAKKGDQKWTSLLLWAGAEPRARVAAIDSEYPEESEGTALEDAVSHGRAEIVGRFKLDSRRDDLYHLLDRSGLTANREVVEMLLKAGADPGSPSAEPAIHSYVLFLGWALESNSPFRRDYRALVDIICLLAQKGARWKPKEAHRFRALRKGLFGLPAGEATDVLRKLVEAGFFPEGVFKELASTPRMRELLNPERYGIGDLRSLAGFGEPKKRRRRS